MWAEMLVRNTLSSYHKNYGHKAQAQVSYRAYPEPTPKSADLEKQKKKKKFRWGGFTQPKIAASTSRPYCYVAFVKPKVENRNNKDSHSN